MDIDFTIKENIINTNIIEQIIKPQIVNQTFDFDIIEPNIALGLYEKIYNFKFNEVILASGKANYVHYQTELADVWLIEHGLNKFPNIQIYDDTGEEIIGEKIKIDLNNTQIKFSEAVQGIAYCD
ncbi:MAG: hypothetical protein ABFD61_00235 [Chloroherpetonaceae bacterium]|jgi:hypothetical protein